MTRLVRGPWKLPVGAALGAAAYYKFASRQNVPINYWTLAGFALVGLVAAGISWFAYPQRGRKQAADSTNEGPSASGSPPANSTFPAAAPVAGNPFGGPRLPPLPPTGQVEAWPVYLLGTMGWLTMCVPGVGLVLSAIAVRMHHALPKSLLRGFVLGTSLAFSTIYVLLIAVGVLLWPVIGPKLADIRERGRQAAEERAAELAGDRPQNFDEMVRNPPTEEDFAEARRQREAQVAELAAKPHDEIVAALLVDHRSGGVTDRAIKHVGPTIVPALLKAVEDPRFRAESERSFGDRSMPLEGVINALEALGSPEAVPVLATLVKDEHEEIRKAVALALGSLGTNDAAAPLILLLADDDEFVSRYGLIGITRALDAERAQSEFKAAVFPPVAQLAIEPDFAIDDAASCLLALDRQRAIDVLTTDEVLSPDNESLTYILEALREADVPVAEPALLKIVTTIKPADTEDYRAARRFSEALRLLSRHDSDAARQAIDKAASHANADVREGAAWARLDALGLDDPFDFGWERLQEVGWEALTPVQRQVLAVEMLEGEVNNGGFDQYFYNSSGDTWPDAQAGLQAIGATEVGKLLARAVARFGSEGPSNDRETRQKQLAKISSAGNSFSTLEDEFYKDENNLQPALLAFIAAHADEFRPTSEPQASEPQASEPQATESSP
jgi:HEAT repeat protein